MAWGGLRSEGRASLRRGAGIGKQRPDCAVRLDVFTASGGGVRVSTPDGEEGQGWAANATMPLCRPRIAHRSDLAASRPFLRTNNHEAV